MASYPTSIFAPATIVAGNTAQPSQINDPNAEIVAIETALIDGPITLQASTLTSLSVTGGSTLTTLSVSGNSTFAGAVGVTGALTAPTIIMSQRIGVRRTAALAVATSTSLTAIPWTDQDYGSTALHSTATNPERITFRDSTGYYLTGCDVAWARDAGGRRKLVCRLNGSSNIAGSGVNGASDLTQQQSLTKLVRANSTTDYVEFCVMQNSGSTGSLDPAVCQAWAYRVSA